MKNPYGSEEQLLNAFLNHERAAEKFIYKEAWPFALSYVTRNKGSYDDAQDNYQDALLAFYKNLKEGKYVKKEDTAYTTYLKTIIRFTWLLTLRYRKNNSYDALPEEEHSSTLTNPEEAEDQEEKLRILREALSQLDEDCRKIITMGYFKKLSHKEIAALFNYTEGFAKKKRHICMKKLIEIYHTLKRSKS